ncbi:hypothetical protein E2C01_028828 [Portunus trituberculatus]|uniref:Uncharacterized protein n=1 Tax=Portunus trituberculatus TaxID=210409 RepID=A0A5B7EQA3_PORTR|nr:hypothetical protein [Portunus trituberculatus]
MTLTDGDDEGDGRCGVGDVKRGKGREGGECVGVRRLQRVGLRPLATSLFSYVPMNLSLDVCQIPRPPPYPLRHASRDK